MTRLEEIKAYWKENYGSAIANGDVDFLLAALAEKEKECEGLKELLESHRQQYADKCLELIAEKDSGGCSYSGAGRGDCEHFVGLPGKSIPNQHDGDDDTVDCYGKPNGWCWSCWKSQQIASLTAKLKEK